MQLDSRPSKAPPVHAVFRNFEQSYFHFTRHSQVDFTGMMAAPFDYEGANDALLDQREANINVLDPTGSAARLIMPPKRQRELLFRPEFHDPKQ